MTGCAIFVGWFIGGGGESSDEKNLHKSKIKIRPFISLAQEALLMSVTIDPCYEAIYLSW